ncbi:MAG: hypothetical protein MR964_05035 [Campylobacter sp.]|uniref:hypothetical protein n=1 Tax=Campylobacter sp. TaxID=205 RepID=UPI002AA8D08A|nr:hypothetical protein [Campylobacter sp.]MCI7023573.1 hypothetical protein [Campylobacter sp.]
MMTDQQKIIIDEELKKIGAKLDNYDEFIEYCKNRGMFGDDVPFYNRVVFTRLNVRKLYKEFLSPIKQASKLLGLTYDELGEKIGCTGSALNNAIVRDKISDWMIKSIELLLENHQLKEQIKKQNAAFRETLKGII